MSGTLISLFDTGPMCRPTPTPWTPAVAAATLAATTAACAAAAWAAEELALLLLLLLLLEWIGEKIAGFLLSGSPTNEQRLKIIT